jgi:SEC-C motif-containing protein
MNTSSKCPCGSQKEYKECCGKYISGQRNAPTAEALMRSRYSAYVKKAFPYIYETYHSDTKQHFTLASIEAQSEQIEWLGLKIISTEEGLENDEKGVVTFSAGHRLNDKNHYLNERSYFSRENGVWRYLNGETQLTTTASNSNKVGRNEPCPCNSGLKYKKCCGKNT